MKHTENNQYSTHHEVSMLLPWYANKTLQGQELTCVESHLKVCLTCRIELESLYKLSARVSNTSAFTPSIETAYSKLHQRIKISDAPELAHGVNADILIDNHPRVKRLPINRLLSGQLTLALAAAWILAVVLIQPVNIDITSTVANQYQTLSSSQSSTAKRDVIQLIFSENIEQSQIDAILESVQGQIISGPNQHGIFTMQLKGDKIGIVDFNERLSLLRKTSNIIFVEPRFAPTQLKNAN